jgi:hypothetical protein
VPLPSATKKALDFVGTILRAADTDPAITFTSFRHGGLTKLGDADLTDAQIRAVSRHKSPKVLTRYVKRTERQIVEATKKRRAGDRRAATRRVAEYRIRSTRAGKAG